MSSVQFSEHLPGSALRNGVETNLRVIEAANDEVGCHSISFQSADRGPQIREKICSRLRSRGIVAVPSPTDEMKILAAKRGGRIPHEVEGDDWHASLQQDPLDFLLQMRNPSHLHAIEAMIHRSIVVGFERNDAYWCLSESTRFWYTDEPVAADSGVLLLPRVSFATHNLGDGKVGVAMDFGHLIRSEQSVGAMLRTSRGRSDFKRLRGRDCGRKGTLIYSTVGTRKSKCYFHDDTDGLTCKTSGVIKFGNERYESLLDYYRKKYPQLPVNPDDPVVRVSFEWNARAVLVNANFLHLRLHLENDEVPKKLRRMSMSPDRRRSQVLSTWSSGLITSVQKSGFEVREELWKPSAEETEQVFGPDLLFGDGQVVHGPDSNRLDQHERYYRQRPVVLHRHGAYRVDTTLSKTIHVVVPSIGGRWTSELHRKFLESIRDESALITKQTNKLHVVTADSVREATERLGSFPPGASLVVFNERDEDGAAYYLLAEDLKRWRLKRITRGTLERAWERLDNAAKGPDQQKAQRHWDDVIFHTVSDLLDQMGTVPWRIAHMGYDACLAIDVSAERRFCALSFLLCRDPERFQGSNGFWRFVQTWTKTETKRETISPVRLRDKIAEVVQNFNGSQLSMMQSILVLRDGHECEGEAQAIEAGLDHWKRMGVLNQNATIDVVDYHKSTTKDLRIWDQCNGEVQNVLGGRVVYLGNAALLCMTGAATVSKNATPEPCLLVGHRSADIRRAAKAVFALGQHNYLSPRTAYRDAAPMRDADHELQRRLAMEVRGLR